MQNNTIAFTILKFPVLVRVQRNFTTVYSIFFFLHSLPKLGVDIVKLLISFLSLFFPPSMFSIHYIFFFVFVLKGTSVALLVSCQIQTLASPWSKSFFVPKSGVLFTGSLSFSVSLETSCHRAPRSPRKKKKKGTGKRQCVSHRCSQSQPCGAEWAEGEGGSKSRAHQRRSKRRGRGAESVGIDGGRTRFDLLLLVAGVEDRGRSGCRRFQPN